MKFFVGVTDYKWFKYLESLAPDEVNFWRPSGLGFAAIDIGEPFLFKLHSPINKIVGGGFFVKSEKLPLSLAWDAFEEKNGASTYGELRNIINPLRSTPDNDPQIGCIILNQPFFLPEDKWIDIPKDWSKNIVVGKTYESTEELGKILWEMVQLNLEEVTIKNQQISEPSVMYGKEYLTKGRLGQGAFRVLVTGAYDRRCAITGEKALPVLEAAHIKSFKEKGPNRINNGLLLRSDFHKLFDRGYITVTKDYRIEVSRKIKEEFNNGKHYYAYHGNELAVLPNFIDEKPNLEFIQWHNENVFRA